MAELTPKARIELRDVVIVFVTGFCSIISSYFMFAGSQSASDVAKMEALYNRIAVLEQVVSELTAASVKKDIQIAQKYEGTTAFKRSLNRMPFPIFIKKVSIENGKATLRNWFINNGYRNRFGVTAEHYKHKTDFEIWDHKTAQQFYEYDLEILRFRNAKCRYEIYPKNALEAVSKTNPLYRGHVCKWYDEIEGADALIGAIIFEDLYKPESKEVKQ